MPAGMMTRHRLAAASVDWYAPSWWVAASWLTSAGTEAAMST